MTLQLTALCFLSHSNTLVFIPIQGVGEGGIGMAVAPLDNGGGGSIWHTTLGAGSLWVLAPSRFKSYSFFQLVCMTFQGSPTDQESTR